METRRSALAWDKYRGQVDDELAVSDLKHQETQPT